jgi:hypothetical protein
MCENRVEKAMSRGHKKLRITVTERLRMGTETPKLAMESTRWKVQSSIRSEGCEEEREYESMITSSQKTKKGNDRKFGTTKSV